MLRYLHLVVKCFTDVGQQTMWQASSLCRACCKAAEKEEKKIHSSTCKSVELPEPVLPTTGFCPVETEMCNHGIKQDFHLWHKKKKMSKKPAACSQLLCTIPVMWAAKADCRLLTVVATAIFKIAICNWLINAAWVQTVLLIKLRGNFRKQFWWVLQGTRRGWTWLSFPSTSSENKQTSKV